MENLLRKNDEKLTETEKSICNAMEQIVIDYDNLEKSQKTNTTITNLIKERIGNIGYDNNYDVSSSYHGDSWLFDLVWYKNNSEGFLEKVGLVLESELSNRKWDGLKFDFEKLLVANSDLKVMISFAFGNSDFPNNVNNLIELYERSVHNYNLLAKNSRILVLIWEDFVEGEIHPYVIVKK